MLYSNIYKASIYFQNLRYEQEIKLLLYAHRCNYMALFAIKQMDYKLGLYVYLTGECNLQLFTI